MQRQTHSTATRRPGGPPIAERLRRLPPDDQGRPVPWFVQWVDGRPCYDKTDPRCFDVAVHQHLCWVCGQRLGTYLSWALEPISIITRRAGVPPQHRECAIHATELWPLPNIPEIQLVWTGKSYQWSESKGAYTFELGPHEQLLWLRKGLPAGRADVIEAVAKRLPEVRERTLATAVGPRQHQAALQALEARCRTALQLVPAT
jgi:hypothetical protein